MLDWFFLLLFLGSIAAIVAGWRYNNPFVYFVGLMVLFYVGLDISYIGIERITGVIDTPDAGGGSHITYIFTPMNMTNDTAIWFLSYLIWGLVLMGTVGMFILLWR